MRKQQNTNSKNKAEIQRVKDAILAETSRLREIRRFEENFLFEVGHMTNRIAQIQKRLADMHTAMADMPRQREEATARLRALKDKYVKAALQPQLEKLRQLRAVLREDGAA
jgi:DNA-binding transcriptional regulator YbjK